MTKRLLGMILAGFVMTGLLGYQSCQKRPLHILALGDSHGASTRGWVYQLQQMLPGDTIYNQSVPGNTLGFNNNGEDRLNTLKNLDAYLKKTLDQSRRLDYVIVLLGTNDCKAVFAGRQSEVPENLRKLIQGIRSYPYPDHHTPEIIVVSPPPYGPDTMLAAKYRGGAPCVRELTLAYQQICKEAPCTFVNVHDLLQPVFMQHTQDGVHQNAAGQTLMAKEIKEMLMLKNK